MMEHIRLQYFPVDMFLIIMVGVTVMAISLNFTIGMVVITKGGILLIVAMGILNLLISILG